MKQSAKYQVDAARPARTTSWTRWRFCSNRQQMGHQARVVGYHYLHLAYLDSCAQYKSWHEDCRGSSAELL